MILAENHQAWAKVSGTQRGEQALEKGQSWQ